MDIQTFFTNFGYLADAPDGVQKLRELILQLAVQGKLVSQDEGDEPASVLLDKNRVEKEKFIREKKTRASQELPKITLNEGSFQLPEGWEWVRLGELGVAQTGTTPPKKDKENCGNYIPFVGPGDIKNHVIDYSGEGLSEQGLSKGRLIEKNSILMVCIGGSIGKHVINDRDISCNQQINTITPYLCVSVKYLFYAMGTRLFQGLVVGAASGSATPIINKQKWSSIPIPLPPETEQQRIVAKVDQLMSLCNELEARQQKQQQVLVRLNNAALDVLLTARESSESSDHWQRIRTNFDLLYDHPETITKLRAAIFQLAVQGKLVRRVTGGISVTETLESARQAKAALESGKRAKATKMLPPLDEPEIPYILPPSWSWVRLNDIILLKHGFAFKSTFFTLEQTPYVLTTPGNFFERGGFRDRGERTKFYRGEIDDEFILSPGDLIIPMTEQAPGLLGSPAFIPNDGRVYLHNQRLAKITLLSQSISPEFVACFFNSAFFRGHLAETCSGTTVRHTSPQKILKVPFPLPPLEEQIRIVAKVYQLMALCDELEAKLNQSQQHSEKLMGATVRQLLVA